MSDDKLGEYVDIYHHEYDYLCKKIYLRRLNGEYVDIPTEIEHPVWRDIKNSIGEVLALWQIALLWFPYKDKVNSDHPLNFNYKNRRRYLLMDLIDSINAYGLDLTSLPPEIKDRSSFEKAPLEHQAKAKIHIDNLSEAIKDFKFSHSYSKLIKQWRMSSARKRSPSLGFLDIPEKPRVIGNFSYPIGWMKYNEEGELIDSVENLPKEILGCRNITIKQMDTYDSWLKHRYPVFKPDELLPYHWGQERWREVLADLHKGILSYPMLNQPCYIKAVDTPSYFIDCGGKYAELFQDADQAYRKSFARHPTAVALFDNLPVLCPHLVKGVDGDASKREARKLIFVGGDYLSWKSFLKAFKRYFPALSN